MDIVINCNDDIISVDGIEMKCRHPRETSKILEEILNRMFSPQRQVVDFVSLDLIDESFQKNIGEW